VHVRARQPHQVSMDTHLWRCSGGDMKVGTFHLHHRVQQFRQRHHLTVSLTISSIVVTPSLTLRSPLLRSVIIPSSTALRRSSREDAPTRINSRSSSVTSITSYKPTRPLYPVLLQRSQPRPRFGFTVFASSAEKPACISAGTGVGSGSVQLRQILRTRRWAHTRLSELATRNGSMPMFI